MDTATVILEDEKYRRNLERWENAKGAPIMSGIGAQNNGRKHEVTAGSSCFVSEIVERKTDYFVLWIALLLSLL